MIDREILIMATQEQVNRMFEFCDDCGLPWKTHVELDFIVYCPPTIWNESWRNAADIEAAFQLIRDQMRLRRTR